MTLTTPLACIVLAAGAGKRMHSAMPKALHPLAGRPMILWLLETVRALGPQKTIVVTGPGMNDVAAAVHPCETIVQETPRGTGDALKSALPALAGFTGDVLILLADTPLLEENSLRRLIAARRGGGGKTGLSVLGVDRENPDSYGRMIADRKGILRHIVEDKDATPAQRAITLCNTGAFCADGARLASWAAKIKNNNAQGEFYITDLPAIAAAEGYKTIVTTTGSEEEAHGVNSRADLAVLEGLAQKKLRQRAMDNGVTLIDPATVYFAHDTLIDPDVVIEPGVFFGPGVSIDGGAHIKAYSHIEGARIGAGAIIGPFARLRPGTIVGRDVRIGNFVEIKNSHLSDGVKANHHGYIGDAELGAGTNFSCGAITANYDGAQKHKTTIGKNVMIGSNVTLVAPLTIGDESYVAAGGTITEDVPGNSLVIARSRQEIKVRKIKKKA